MPTRSLSLLVGILLVTAIDGSVHPGGAQQVMDTAFRAVVTRPAFARGAGPPVLIDQAHFNAMDSQRYQPAIDMLTRDGYVVRTLGGPVTSTALRGVRIFLSFVYGSSARDAINTLTRENPGRPNIGAFSDAEVLALRDWVSGGGSLLLAIDHEPAPLAVENLVTALGVRFLNGIAYIDRSARLTFRRADGTLLDHPITKGIHEITTFGGAGFQLQRMGDPILTFGPDVRAWIARDSAEIAARGWLQGAAFTFGKGRVVLFGEAGMFTAQLSGPRRNPMGMNAPSARENSRLLLNAIHWLSRVQ